MNIKTGQIVYQDQIDKMLFPESEDYRPINRPITRREHYVMKINPYSPCGCGSGKKFKFCCKVKGS